jgi:ABC-type multidrug transport system fused ATPase/permease subunit
VRDLRIILGFGWKYMRPYWRRVVTGVIVGCICGLTASVFLWAGGLMMERLQGKGPATVNCPSCNAEFKVQPKAKVDKVQDKLFPVLRQRAAEWQQRLNDTIDPWLLRGDAKMDAQRILGTLLFLPLIALVRGVTDYVSNYCMGWVGERVVNDLRCDVLTKLTSLSLDYFTRSTTGDMLTRINQDTFNLHKALRQAGSDLVRESFTILGAFVVLWFLDWRVALVILLAVPVAAIPLVVLGGKARKAGRGSRSATVRQNSLLVEALTGIRVLKAFNLEAHQNERYRQFSREFIRHAMKGVQAKELSGPFMEILSAVGLSAILVYLFWSGLEIHQIIMLIGALAVLLAPLKKLASLHIAFEQAGAGVERLVELLREQPSVVPPAQPKPLPVFAREIRFENVDFTYGNKAVLRNISLSIPRGFKLGIAGESGSGKSTLINLLFRFYDVTAGSVKIDGIDVRELSFEDLRGPMALVSQDVFVFRTSVAENIAAGRTGATRPEIEAAAKAAHAHEFIMQLPQGYDTIIGERGMTLSGGQRQRLAIARAFVRNAPILVLDEATASLDSQSEMEVQSAIDLLEKNRTVICIAHRLSTLSNMDQIIVLSKEGRIAEQGTFDELVRAKGLFATMAARQGIFAGM